MNFFEALRAAKNDPNRLQSMIGSARGETGESGTNLPPEIQSIPKDDLSQYDRFAQYAGEEGPISKYTNLLGAPLVASGYEMSKLSPDFMNNIVAPTIDFFKPGSGNEFRMDESTSRPSFKNIAAATRGAIYGAFGK
jgi:hypothetical protein